MHTREHEMAVGGESDIPEIGHPAVVRVRRGDSQSLPQPIHLILTLANHALHAL